MTALQLVVGIMACGILVPGAFAEPTKAPDIAIAMERSLPSVGVSGTSDHEPVQEEVANDFCAAGSWSLTGSALLPTHPGNDLLAPEWERTLESIAACVGSRENDLACLVVQGRFDERLFSDAVVAAFGSQAAAQRARARSRATAVLDRLFELGVETHRLRESLPPRESSFRGVEVTMVRDCLPRPAYHLDTDSSIEVIGEDAFIDEGKDDLSDGSDNVARPDPSLHTAKPVVRRWPLLSVELGPDSSLTWAEPSPLFSGGLRLVVLGQRERFQARIGTGLSSSSRVEHRAGWELTGSFGYSLLDWLSVGLAGGVRFGSVGLTAPWLERSWFAGFEAVECLLKLGHATEICLHQAVSPIGSQTRRATIENGRLQRMPLTNERLLRFHIGAMLRHEM